MKFMYKYKIASISYSVQTKGYNSGKPAVFIKFVNFSKPEGNYQELTSGEIAEKVNNLIPDNIYPMIVFTGYEPLKQLNSNFTLVEKLNNYFICLESDGNIKPNYAGINWLTVIPNAENNVNISFANEVIFNVNEKGIIHPPNSGLFKANFYFLQPLPNSKSALRIATNQCLNFILGKVKDSFYPNVDWRLSFDYAEFLE